MARYKTLSGAAPAAGDIIQNTFTCYPVKIARVLYADYYPRDGYDIELIDPAGNYRHWKQWADGGQLVREKKLIGCYGMDYTDIFEKYGML